jgi:ABC-type transport system involved in multi-copper enzyme maturation permease subunit
MNWSEIKVIFDFCILDTRRTKTLLIFPILFDLYLCLPCSQSPLETQVQPIPGSCRIGFIGEMNGLRERFYDPSFRIVPLKHPDPDVCMSEREADIIVSVPPDSDVAISKERADQPSTLPVMHVCSDTNDSVMESNTNKVLDILYDYREDELKNWLSSAGLSQHWRLKWISEADQSSRASALAPMDLAKAPAKRRLHATSEVLMALSAILALLACMITGGFIRDEQQKGILSLMLISPNSGASIVIALFLFAIVFCAANILAALLLSVSYVNCIAPPEWTVPGAAALVLFLSSLPMAVFSSACGILSATFIRSDNRFYAALIINSALQSLLAAVVFMPNHMQVGLLQAIPISNVLINLKELLAGSPGIVGPLVVSSLVTIVWSTPLLLLTMHRVNNGKLLDHTVPKTAGQAT